MGLRKDSDGTTRAEVYAAIDTEREYQDTIVETDPSRCSQTGPAHSVGDYLTMMATYLRKAQDDWTGTAGNDAALDQIRKIAGIAVHCMEDHGAPKRDLPNKEKKPGALLSFFRPPEGKRHPANKLMEARDAAHDFQRTIEGSEIEK